MGGQIFAQQSSLNIYGIGVNRYGFGINYKYNRANNSNQLWTKGDLFFELGNIIHPREVALVNQTLQNSGIYKYGKINYAWTLRSYYMVKRQLSARQDRKNIALNAICGLGLPVSYYWPVYINYFEPTIGPNGTTSQVRYNPEIHQQSQIVGRTNSSKGISQGTLLPGAGINAGLEFIWGNYRSDVKVLTLGAKLEAYSKALPILYKNDLNSRLFSMFYVNFALGFGKN